MTTPTGATRDGRQKLNPLFNANKMKLGIFGYNGNGPQMTMARERFVTDWSRSRKLATQAAKMGLERL